jgi:hypothetical protein
MLFICLLDLFSNFRCSLKFVVISLLHGYPGDLKSKYQQKYKLAG